MYMYNKKNSKHQVYYIILTKLYLIANSRWPIL